jgi:hypothetical protein
MAAAERIAAVILTSTFVANSLLADVKVCNYAASPAQVVVGGTIYVDDHLGVDESWTSRTKTIQSNTCATVFAGAISDNVMFYHIESSTVTTDTPLYTPVLQGPLAGRSPGTEVTLPRTVGCIAGNGIAKRALGGSAFPSCSGNRGVIGWFQFIPTNGRQNVTIGHRCEKDYSNRGGGRSGYAIDVCSSKVDAFDSLPAPPRPQPPPQPPPQPQPQPQPPGNQVRTLQPRCLCTFGNSAVAHFIDDGFVPFQPPVIGAVVRITPSQNCPNVGVCDGGVVVSPPGVGYLVRVSSVDRVDNFINGKRGYVVRGDNLGIASAR